MGRSHSAGLHWSGARAWDHRPLSEILGCEHNSINRTDRPLGSIVVIHSSLTHHREARGGEGEAWECTVSGTVVRLTGEGEGSERDVGCSVESVE